MRRLLLALVALTALPATGADLAACAAIDADAARLACYDALAGRAESPAEAPAAAADARFGAEQLASQPSADKGPDLIESTLTGTFKGWDRNTVFTLANGQAWRCIDCRPVYFVRENPQVTITRNFLGSYWLKVEDLNLQARVRRVR
ncbi:hypothetical protein AAG565_15290 [Fontimonas sp. SYSU GA230001]|uniref:hypothetical protein n=1 Tax=Fontimonas sp. SYSU GA230001 TaxID=3142450 RepID=UPI0032B4A633